MFARRRIRRSHVRHVLEQQAALQGLHDSELRARAADLRWSALSGETSNDWLVTAAALVREATRRTVGYEQYPVQLEGGLAMYTGGITEMQTGEGKTLSAVLPAFLRALRGWGSHVLTVNDYLAARDAENMGPIYEALGLTVGCVIGESTPDERQSAYASDVTYGTAKEVGFDYLRERLTRGSDALAGSPSTERRHFALVDEADSVLIDDARTPLIIALPEPLRPADLSLYRWSARAASSLAPEADFVYRPDRREATLTDQGCRKLVLMGKSPLMGTQDSERIFEHVERAIAAELGFRSDRDYMIVDDLVWIVDESTGRVLEGRKWQNGLHQAIEAKEGLPVTSGTGQAARITIQSLFRQYEHLAGMTGTALQAAREFRKIYRLRSTAIPTHRPCIRQELATQIFASLAEKQSAVAKEIQRMRDTGRAVLVGTPSISASEALATVLEEQGIEHCVLNARHHETEADIVAEAGQPGRVTIATNMAGRGTDIALHPSVRDAGGLHVIATEMHSSRRIDRQLIGRAARQGDPGSFRFFLSLEDELLRDRRQRSPRPQGPLSTRYLRIFRGTQRRLESQHRRERTQLLKHERTRHRKYTQAGLDPCLELTE